MNQRKLYTVGFFTIVGVFALKDVCRTIITVSAIRNGYDIKTKI